VFYSSCGDPSERPGREAGEEHNNYTTAGSTTGTTGGNIDMGEDTTSGMQGQDTLSGIQGADTSANLGDDNAGEDTASARGDENFQPRQKGGSTPADREGNYK
jgi:hypothetical protein